jgi:hypothetical protein
MSVPDTRPVHACSCANIHFCPLLLQLSPRPSLSLLEHTLGTTLRTWKLLSPDSPSGPLPFLPLANSSEAHARSHQLVSSWRVLEAADESTQHLSKRAL